MDGEEREHHDRTSCCDRLRTVEIVVRKCIEKPRPEYSERQFDAKRHMGTRNHGTFGVGILRAYFSSKTWYDGIVPPDQFSEDVFNQYEIANRDLIVRNEEKRKGNH